MNLFLASNYNLLLWMLLVPIVLILSLVVVAVVVRIVKMVKEHDAVQLKVGIDPEQQGIFLEAYGGKDNIVAVSQQMSRLTVEVKELEKVNFQGLKDLGATGVLITGNVVKCSFGERAANIYNLLK